jgi:hypothetical protein
MKPEQAKMLAVMNVEEGEKILGAWVTPTIPEIGVYKLLAKRKQDGTCEWAHFVQRADGRKEKVYRGTVESESRLKEVVTAIDAALGKTFGPNVQLQLAHADFYSLDGKKLADGPPN